MMDNLPDQIVAQAFAQAEFLAPAWGVEPGQMVGVIWERLALAKSRGAVSGWSRLAKWAWVDHVRAVESVGGFGFGRSLKRSHFLTTIQYDEADGWDSPYGPYEPAAPSATDGCDHEELAQRAAQLLGALDSRSRRIVELSFGFGCPPVPRSDIATALGLSPSRVGQLLAVAITELRRRTGCECGEA